MRKSNTDNKKESRTPTLTFPGFPFSFIMFGILVAALFYLHITKGSISEKYKMLPVIYEMDDYVICMERNDLYCKSDIKLRNNSYENNIYWEIIDESKNDIYSYDRSVIHRAICVPKTEPSNMTSIRKFTELRVNEKLKKINLVSYVEDITCITKDFKISFYDIIFLISLGMYIFLILYATVYDIRKRKNKCKSENTSNKVVILCFSLISNWEKLCKVDGNEDYNKLKSIQGIRFYIMLSIIFMHTKLSYNLIYHSNPEYSEEITRNAFIEKLCVLDVFMVQIFFLISSWILTFQIYNIYIEQGEFTVKQALYMFINRYFRLAVCSTVMVLLLRSSWYRIFEGPVTFDNNDVFQRACKDNWWQTLFFLNNHLYLKDLCLPSSWYLSVDFQLYAMAIVTIYVILKLKLNEWKALMFIFFISYTLYGLVIYVNDMDIIYRITSNSLTRYKFYRSESFKILYASTYSSWTTSVVGVCLGIVYTKNKRRNITNNKVVSISCQLMMFILPSAAVLISGKQYKGISAAILGPLVKPLYSAGIGIGILGMSHNIGGFMKRVCENKFVVLMSNFSFSIYVFQILVIFSKGTGSYSLMEYGVTKMFKSFLFFDAPLSILAGIIGALLFEQPGINLQKMFLPQPFRGKQQEKDV